MLADNAKSDSAALLTFFDKGVGGAPKLVVGGVGKAVVRGGICSEGDDPAGKPAGELFDAVDSLVDDQKAVLGKDLGKSSERLADIVDILKEVQMILFNVQNDAEAGKKLKKEFVYSHASATK